MNIEFDVTDLVAFAIDFTQRTAAVTDVDSFATCIVPQIVSIITVLQPLQRCVRTSIEDTNAAILSVRNIDSVRFGYEENPLRLLQLTDCLHSLAGLHVDDFQCVIPEGRDKKTLAFYVHRKMIDSTLHVWHLNRSLQLQGLCRLSARHRST